jgi:gingipain R
MKRWKLWLAVVLLLPVCARAQQSKVLHMAEGSLKVLSTDATGCVVELTTGKVMLQYDSIRRGYVITAEQGVAMMEATAPSVPKVPYSLQVPGDAGAVMELVAADSIAVPNIDLLPGYGNTTRPQAKPTQVGKGKSYNKNEFFPGYQVASRPVHQIRGAYGQAFWLFPVQYNPVTKELKIYTRMKWVVKYAKAFNTPSPLDSEPKEWRAMLQQRWLNAAGMLAKTTNTSLPEEGSLLVFTKATHLNTLQPFIEWKQQCGRKVTVVNIDTLSGGAGANNIRNYIVDHYQQLNASYVLLVGDHDELPALQQAWLAGPSDAGYGMVAGTDHYPDLMVGRFSCNNEQQLQTQVERSIRYEKMPSLQSGIYDRAVGIASEEGPGDNNEFDWQHLRNIRTGLQVYGYSQVSELYDGSQGAGDAPGNPVAADVTAAINSNAGLLNYIGHGNALAWYTSAYTVNHVPQLTNTNGAWPFVVGVACSSGDFLNQTCLAEALLQARYNNQPAGAIGVYMSTIPQSWDPPMKAQDDMMQALTIQGTAGNARSLGGLTTDGCIGMNDAYDADGAAMTDTWVLFGDPSLRLRTRVPATFTVQHAAHIPFQTTALTVTVSQPGKAALYYNDSILAVADVPAGATTLQFAPLTVYDTMLVTVTAPETQPYQGAVIVGSPVGVPEVAASAGITLWPNPVQDVLQISGLKVPAVLMLYNAAGALVLQTSLAAGTATIDLSRFPAGMYQPMLTGPGYSFLSLSPVVKR